MDIPAPYVASQIRVTPNTNRLSPASHLPHLAYPPTSTSPQTSCTDSYKGAYRVVANPHARLQCAQLRVSSSSRTDGIISDTCSPFGPSLDM